MENERGSVRYRQLDLDLDSDRGKARRKRGQKTTKRNTRGKKERKVYTIILPYTQSFKGHSRDKTKRKRI